MLLHDLRGRARPGKPGGPHSPPMLPGRPALAIMAYAEPAPPEARPREGPRMSSYLRTVETVYAEAARQPDGSLCCTASPLWRFPELRVPPVMQEMNYGCGS